MALISLIAVVVVIAVVSFINYINSTKKNQLPAGIQRLPGPKGYPILGSVPDVPDKNSFLKFHEWGQEFGPIYQTNLAGQNHVWITRDGVAQELLGKRAANNSERPFIPSLQADNRNSGHYLPLMSRNELWTRQRKFAKQIMNKSSANAFYNYPELESVRLLFELMTDPSRYNHALESFISRVTCRLGWGTAAPSDELKQRARELLIGVSPNGALTNKLGFLKKLPEAIVPAKAWEFRRYRTESRFFTILQNEVREKLKNKTAPESWMRHFLENKATTGFASDLEGAYAVGMHGIAGALTIAAPMQSFCLAMCHYPQYQAVLHEEIDRVCGDELPKLSNMPDMPVLRAFIRETMRWRPPVPTGIPHESVKDDIYEGYFIPAGSVMHPLEWSISRDPEVFPEPDEFNPMRWLETKYPTYQQPLTKYPTITQYSQFGYGRRICAGMGVAEADLFVGIGSLAWMFTLSASDTEPESAAELPEEPNLEFAKGLSRARTVTYKLRLPGSSLPGQFPAFFEQHTGPNTPPSSPKARTAMAGTSDMPAVDNMFNSAVDEKASKPDPTLEYSSLLIAKPLPFKFNMKIRDKKKAEHVAREWMFYKMDGEFEDSKCYWEGGNAGNKQYGWGEVHK
ncbi:cytochrome P450 [Aureobasidium namibiae CBS 147.97]|uniref:Cytochrome P450 n=1 Tax=Aureobasidium namibiae CBS 147.97 TaxID=1043004 RepID=A0A074X413_9PEZI|nr:cytochrome P450 [Aureobasidium namibiae CBS 147.97]KEQ76772.1 cytochrome P450 [Aureobasidium namibiae CBS 147.97]